MIMYVRMTVCTYVLCLVNMYVGACVIMYVCTYVRTCMTVRTFVYTMYVCVWCV